MQGKPRLWLPKRIRWMMSSRTTGGKLLFRSAPLVNAVNSGGGACFFSWTPGGGVGGGSLTQRQNFGPQSDLEVQGVQKKSWGGPTSCITLQSAKQRQQKHGWARAREELKRKEQELASRRQQVEEVYWGLFCSVKCFFGRYEEQEHILRTTILPENLCFEKSCII